MIYLAIVCFVLGVSGLAYQMSKSFKNAVDGYIHRANVRRLNRTVNGK